MKIFVVALLAIGKAVTIVGAREKSRGLLDNYSCYGDVLGITDETGASCATAAQDGLSNCGTAASHEMAETDSVRMANYRDEILSVAQKYCMDPAVIAGIISRESRAGYTLDRNGYGDNGNAYGLMQIDIRYHPPTGGPYSRENIEQGTEILIDMINGVAANHKTWTQAMALKGGINAYNSGVGNVQTYHDIDVGTINNDYANDVSSRSEWYSYNGYP